MPLSLQLLACGGGDAPPGNAADAGDAADSADGHLAETSGKPEVGEDARTIDGDAAAPKIHPPDGATDATSDGAAARHPTMTLVPIAGQHLVYKVYGAAELLLELATGNAPIETAADTNAARTPSSKPGPN